MAYMDYIDLAYMDYIDLASKKGHYTLSLTHPFFPISVKSPFLAFFFYLRALELLKNALLRVYICKNLSEGGPLVFRFALL